MLPDMLNWKITAKRQLQRKLRRVRSALLQPAYQTGLELLASRANMLARLVRLVAAQVQEIKCERQPSPGTKQISILALSPQEFRHDLGVLAEQGVRVLCMPFRWQERLLRSFYREAVTTPDIHLPAAGSHAKKAKDAYRKFLRTFLPKFYNRLGVDAVIGANVRYKEDLDIGAVSKQVGVPYIVFHRENLAITDGVYNVVTERYRKLGRFQGSCIAVHNNIAARSFIETAYADAARVAQLGCLRMDNFLRRIQMPRSKRVRPLVTLFSFKSFMRGIFGQEGYFPVFRDSHGPIALLAARHPEIDFLIKPKTGAVRHP